MNQQTHGQQIAKYRPSAFRRPIRLYADGWIESPFGSGSAYNATAHIDQAGNKKLIRDFREAYFTIEGPYIAISIPIQTYDVARARQFAARVNQAAQASVTA